MLFNLIFHKFPGINSSQYLPILILIRIETIWSLWLKILHYYPFVENGLTGDHWICEKGIKLLNPFTSITLVCFLEFDLNSFEISSVCLLDHSIKIKLGTGIYLFHILNLLENLSFTIRST